MRWLSSYLRGRQAKTCFRGVKSASSTDKCSTATCSTETCSTATCSTETCSTETCSSETCSTDTCSTDMCTDMYYTMLCKEVETIKHSSNKKV